jgi:hypothetical protein
MKSCLTSIAALSELPTETSELLTELAMANEVLVKVSKAEANTIEDLCSSRERLNFGDDPDFPHHWLVRTLLVELEKINFEDDRTDRTSQEYREARALLTALRENPDWLHPKLAKFLCSYRETAHAPEIKTRRELKKIAPNGHAGATIAFRAPTAGTAVLQVSGLLADLVPVMEDTLADPDLCKALESALIERLKSLIEKCAITHLCFIEKEVGPIGALLMFSAAVSATGLPACVFRETNWARRSAIAGRSPGKSDRVAFVYDLIVSGVGIASAARSLFELTGAQTVAALVLFRYGVDNEIQGSDGRTIHVESLAHGRLERVSDTFSEAAHIGNVAGEGAVSLQKPTTDADDGPESGLVKSASTKGDAMEDLRENAPAKKSGNVLRKSRQDEEEAIKQKWREDRNRTRAAAEAAIEKKVPRPPADLELVERFALEPEGLSKLELKAVNAMLEKNPSLRAEAQEISKQRGRFRARAPNPKG